jgi:hypothetical protein
VSFLYPAFLLGALAIALPVALHLLRRDVAPEVPFSAVRLLRRSPIDRTRRRRLRDLLLLAARVAALTLLAVAFARPYLIGPSASSPARIVAIDRSFSMDAPGRFARALELAYGAVSEAGASERVAVIAFDDAAEVVAGAGSASDARAAIATLAPGFGATRFAAAIAKAVEVAEGGPAHIVIVSDLQRSGWEDQQPVPVRADIRVETRDAGARLPNAAVTQVRVEADRIVARVANNATAPFSGPVRVSVDGREVGSSHVRVAPESSTDVAIAYRAGDRGSLMVAIDDTKGYPADNTRYALIGLPSRPRVMVITTAGSRQSGLYFTRALEAMDDEVFQIRVASGAEASAVSAAHVREYAAIVILSTRGLDRHGRDMLAGSLRAGGGVLIAAGPEVDASVLSSAFGWAGLTDAQEPPGATVALSASDVRHPIFRPFGPFAVNLGQVRFERIWKLRPEGWEVVARFTDGNPALVERREEKGRAMIFASDMDRQWNEFPLHPAFVPFAVETVRHVAAAEQRPREYLVADAPSWAGRTPGVYATNDGRAAAVNVDVRESAAERLTTDEFLEMLTRVTGADGAGPPQGPRRAETAEATGNLWQYGLVLMLAVLVLESVVGRA